MMGEEEYSEECVVVFDVFCVSPSSLQGYSKSDDQLRVAPGRANVRRQRRLARMQICGDPFDVAKLGNKGRRAQGKTRRDKLQKQLTSTW
jgi:hypothetical protein